MQRADTWSQNLMRCVSNGDVILVQQVARATRSAPQPRRAAPEPVAAGVAEEVPAPPSHLVSAGEDWSCTPAPPGYAYEFGTGRLLPIETHRFS